MLKKGFSLFSLLTLLIIMISIGSQGQNIKTLQNLEKNESYIYNITNQDSTFWNVSQVIEGFHPVSVSSNNSMIALVELMGGVGGSTISGQQGNKVFINNFINQTTQFVLDNHSSEIYTGAFSDNDSIFASSSADNTIKLWNLTNGIEISTLVGHVPGSHGNGSRAITFINNTTLLASGGLDNSVKIWNHSDGGLINSIIQHTSGILAIDSSTDGKMLVTGGYDYNVIAWNISDTSNITYENIFTSDTPIVDLAFSENDGLLVVADYNNMHFFDLNNNFTSIKSIPGPNSQIIHHIEIFPNSSNLVVVGASGNPEFWTMDTFEQTELLILDDYGSFSTFITIEGYIIGGVSNETIIMEEETSTISNPPTDLTVEYLDDRVKLAWNYPNFDGGSNISLFKIYRSLNGSIFDEIGTTNLLNASDYTIEQNNTYYYKIHAINTIGESTGSNVVEISIPISSTSSTVSMSTTTTSVESSTSISSSTNSSENPTFTTSNVSGFNVWLSFMTLLITGVYLLVFRRKTK